MTPQDQQNHENSDNFDRLLANRSEISEFVNSFTSERVQRKAFDAIVCSLGLADRGVPETPNVEGLRIITPPHLGADADPGEDETEESDGGGNRRRRVRSSSKKSFTITRGLNFAPDGHPTFENYIAEKAPKNNDEKSLIACYYLSEMMDLSEVGIGDILAAYQAAGWSAPAHPDKTLRSNASRTGWIDTASTKAIKVVWKGENYLSTKMPSDAK